MAFTMKTGDTSPIVTATFKDADLNPVNITGSTVRIHVVSLSGTTLIDEAMTVTSGPNGVAEYEWQAGDTDTAGTYKVEFEVTYSDNTVETFPNTGHEMLIIKDDLL